MGKKTFSVTGDLRRYSALWVPRDWLPAGQSDLTVTWGMPP
jgi:hypothetical protein